jgi:ferrous iron transport protein A
MLLVSPPLILENSPMLTTGFSVQGSSLKLLRTGEQGTITRINATAHSLREMGIKLGQLVALEERFPRFVIRVGGHRYALSDDAIRSIYVRITKQ